MLMLSTFAQSYYYEEHLYGVPKSNIQKNYELFAYDELGNCLKTWKKIKKALEELFKFWILFKYEMDDNRWNFQFGCVIIWIMVDLAFTNSTISGIK